MLPPKNRPRYLPTLTHVVTADEIAEADSSAPFGHAATAPVDSEQRINQMVQSLMPAITARIHESLQEILDDKLHQLEAELRRELESLVRRAVNGCGESSDE